MKNSRLMPLFWLELFDTASYTIRYPVLTLVFFDNATRLFPLTTSMATRSEWYGICTALYWIGSFFAGPILSAWSDYVGRRKVLLFGSMGTLIFALCMAVGAYTGSLAWVLLGGLLGGACTRIDPIVQAAVGDVCVAEHKMRAMSYLQFFIAIGAFLGPLIGGFFAQRFWFSHLNFSLPFIIAAVLAGAGLYITLQFFQETALIKNGRIAIANNNRSDMLQLRLKSFQAIVANKKVLAISLLLILIQFSWSMYYQFITPILKKEFIFSGTEIGVFLGIIAVWLALGSISIPLLQRFLSTQKILFYAIVAIMVGILGTLLVTLWHPFLWLRYFNWIFAIPVAAGDVITYCAITTLYSDAVTPAEQGQVMGANFIIIPVVWASTAFLGGYLNGINSVLPLCLALAGVGLLSMAFRKIWVIIQY